MNASLANQNRKPIYCPPPKLALQPDQALDILNKYISGPINMLDYPIGPTFIDSLVEVFPCK